MDDPYWTSRKSNSEMIELSSMNNRFLQGAALTSADSNLLQEILEETEVPLRLRKTLELLKKEYAMCMLQQKIGKEVLYSVVSW